MMAVNRYFEEAKSAPPCHGVPAGDALPAGDAGDTRAAPIRLVLLSASEDGEVMELLAKHLEFAHEDGVELWSSQALLAGSHESDERQRAVADADVIVVGLSIHFVASESFSQISNEIGARRRHGADVIPLLLRSIEWETSMFGDLRPLPANRLPIDRWTNQGAAVVEVARGIGKVIAAQRRRHGLPASCTCVRAGVRAARQVLTWKVGTAALALISMAAITYGLTRPAPPTVEPKRDDCTCPGALVLPIQAERSGRSSPFTSALREPAEDGEALVFERVQIAPPTPKAMPDSPTPKEPTLPTTEPSPDTPPQVGATSSVVVPMSQGQISAVMNRGKHRAKNGCREGLARSGSVSVSVQFNDGDGRAAKIAVRSPAPLDEATRQCVRSAFSGAKVTPGNGGYRVNGWTVQ